jgi:hypothetical protein
MSLLPSSGVAIDAVIVDVNQSVYKRGTAKGLLRIEIGVEPSELHKVIKAYPGHYGVLLNSSSYGTSRGRRSAYLPITIVFGKNKYQAKLASPKCALRQLISGSSIGGCYIAPWVPASPVKDQHSSNVKLVEAFRHAGFPVTQWTVQALSLTLPKKRARPIQPVKFRVQDRIWTLLSPS